MEKYMEGLSINNILDQEDIENLFISEEEENKQETITENSQNASSENEEKDSKTTEGLNVEELFDDTPESVGSEEHQEGEDTTFSADTGASPKNNNFYSSIAKALKEDGVFPELDDTVVNNIKEAEDFAEMFEAQVQARLEEKQRRIEDALNVGVDTQVIQQYENTIKYLDNIKEEDLSEENEAGENLRKQLIFQDLLNRGYKNEEAQEELKDIFDNGTDVKKAKRALNSNKEFFKAQYKSIIDKAKESANEEEKQRKKQAELLKKSILEDKAAFGELNLDATTRQKVFETISKPIYKDSETGELYTALQKYEKENRNEFLKNVGLLFTLTDGFKNLDKLTKSKVQKEVKKSIRELEHTLSNTVKSTDGNLKFVSGVSEDPNTFIGKWDIDI